MENINEIEMRDEWADLDDLYDYAPVKRGKPVNNNMATLKRVEGVINRYRKAGIL